MKAEAVITVDTSEAQKKLDSVLNKLNRIHVFINRSWALRLFFYGQVKKLDSPDVFVSVEDDGSQWVMLEDYLEAKKEAAR